MNKLKGLIYRIVLKLAASGPRKNFAAKKILVVRVDEIGDYVLWHKFLADYVRAERFAGCTWHFCGNQSWRPLFMTLDSEGIDHTIWIDKKRFKKDMRYRFSFLRNIYREHYDVVINPTFSRDPRYDDAIVMATKANRRFAMKANLESVQPYEAGNDKGLYTDVMDDAAKPLFEFYRNRAFADFVLQKKSAITDTRIDVSRVPVFTSDLPENFFVIFPGSRSSTRIWPTQNFIAVSKYLYERSGWTVVTCGAASDEPYTRPFIGQYPYPVIDLTAKTSLTDMLQVFSRAKCLVSVDTGSVHLATAMGCTVFGIFNGSQFGRFAPYPEELAPSFYAVYPDSVEEDLKDESNILSKYEFVVDIPYASVTPQKMISVIKRTLK